MPADSAAWTPESTPEYLSWLVGKTRGNRKYQTCILHPVSESGSLPFELDTMGLIADTKRAIQDSPKGIFNWYVLMCTWIFAFSGVSKGFDEGKMLSM